MRTGRPRHPQAEALLALGVGRVERQEYPPSEEVRPAYLREPDVNINWKSLREEGPWPGTA